jgi:hypothetical protein
MEPASGEIDSTLLRYLGKPPAGAYRQASLVRRILEALDRCAESGVRIEDGTRLMKYMVRYRRMADVLPPLAETARREVPDARLVLKLYTDPEIQYSCLYLQVEDASLDCDELMRRIDRIWEQCQNLLEGEGGWVVVSTDFEDCQSSDGEISLD